MRSRSRRRTAPASAPESVLTAIRHGHVQTLDSLHFLDNALADQCGERGAVRSGLSQHVRFENKPTGVPCRQTGAPSQRGDDRFLRGSTLRARPHQVRRGGGSIALCAALETATDPVDRHTAPACSSAGTIEVRLLPSADRAASISSLPWSASSVSSRRWAGVNWLRSQTLSVDRTEGRARCEAPGGRKRESAP